MKNFIAILRRYSIAMIMNFAGLVLALTAFMVLMLLVGIVIGMFIPASLPTLLRSAIKLLLLPVTVGIGYELIKLAGRHDNLFTRVISQPGMWFQRITTVEPDDGMIECAIKAFIEVLPEDEKKAEW